MGKYYNIKKRWTNRGDGMLYKRQILGNPYGNIAENIKRDLIASFQKKGMDIERIHVDMDSEKLNLKVQISEKRNSTFIFDV